MRVLTGPQERTNCLNRESPIILRSDLLRRCRKSLLSELSALVKCAKRLQECQRSPMSLTEEINDIIDEMILKAFRIVTKAVRFLDMLEEDRRARAPSSVTVMATVAEESYVLPTPPSDRLKFDEQSQDTVSDAGTRATGDDAATSVATSESSEMATSHMQPWSKRVSSLSRPASHRWSQAGPPQTHRVSSSMSHRVSLAGPSPLSQPHNLVSERLNRSHDKFLSHLGSFIGRLHLQSQSRPELALAIKQSATSGCELLTVVDAVAVHNNPGSEYLRHVRAAMCERIRELVFSARDTLVHAATEDADVIMPHDNNILLMAATGCVRAAGECVAKAKASIERVGDFEFEIEGLTVDIDLEILDIAEEQSRKPSVAETVVSVDTVSCTESNRFSGSSSEGPRRLTVVPVDKPLPDVPHSPSAACTMDSERQPLQNQTSPISRRSSVNEETTSNMSSSISSLRPTLPPLPKLSTTIFPPDQHEVHTHSPHGSDTQSSRIDSVVVSSAGSSATYLSRDSEASMASQTSTRATTPDHGLAPRNQPSVSDLSAAASSTHTEEVDDVESRLLERTYAHELMFNKEGQVTGGSLPALVERLTTHESTPDPTFVSAFYLTFRLFCTPVKLAEVLIERFEYVGESPHISGPVRLRVYNAFKGWLESHWREHTDREALRLITAFSETRLSTVLPSAGRRLLDLATKVSSQGMLAPRLVSSMGKTNTSIAHYVPADTPLPSPVLSKGQQNMLNSFKKGSNCPTILDFEPLELARQLTIKQMSIFCSILPEELLGSQWMKKSGVDAPNVKAMSSLSTDLSNLVADTILQYSEVKKRAAAIKQWIKIANQCYELQNYDGLMAIICSLNSSTISRLRKTWDAVSPKRKEMLRTLQEIVEPAQNNKVLRARLHDHIPPCLPFLGMYLTDLTFVDIGNPSTKQMMLGNETDDDKGSGLTVVNFDKHTRTAKIIGDLQRFQIPYRLTELPDMQEWMVAQINRVREGDQGNVQVSYYRKSLLLEPREMAARAPVDMPMPANPSANSSRTDLFGWMSRDRGGQTATPTQV